MSALRERWREMREFDTRRPEGVRRRDHLRFLRAWWACLLLGHPEARTKLHRFEKVGDGRRGRMELRDACSRCGLPLEERRSRPIQFPQPRDAAWPR